MKLLKVITKILSSASKLNSDLVLKLEGVLSELSALSEQGGKLCVELTLDKNGKVSVETKKELPKVKKPSGTKVVKPVVKKTVAKATPKKK